MLDAAVSLPRARVTTPQRLMLFMGGITALALLAAILSLWTASRIHDAAQTVGRDAEPSVALALRMQATLGDLDASAFSDSLTDAGATIGTSTRFRAGLDRLGADLVDAARNITYGDAEAIPIGDLQKLIPRYEEAIVEARDLASGNLWVTSRRLQWASRVDRDFMVPAAEALAAANADQLEQRYGSYRETSLVFAVATFLAFALLVAALLAAQVWLAGRMRRIVNPLLAAATLVACAAGLWFGAETLGERSNLRAAKLDAYDSLHILFEAKSAANVLRAAMSLWLLDPAARADAQQRMEAAAHALIGTDLTRPDQARPMMSVLSQALNDERDGNASRAASATPKAGGLLGAELGNITFGVPEREAATESVADLGFAEEVVRAVQVQEGRNHGLAVERWLDETPRGGTGAFLALQSALDRTIAVNQSAFDESVTSALARASLMPVVSTVALLVTALLAASGLWLRLREYR